MNIEVFCTKDCHGALSPVWASNASLYSSETWSMYLSRSPTSLNFPLPHPLRGPGSHHHSRAFCQG